MFLRTIAQPSNCLPATGWLTTLVYLALVPTLFAQSSTDDFTVGYYRHLLSTVPENSREYSDIKLNMGVALCIDGDFGEARNIFLDLRASYDQKQAVYNLVLVDLVLGKKDEAKELVASHRDLGSGVGAFNDKFMNLPPDEVKAAIFHGETVAHPNNWRAYARLGSIQAKLNHYAEATEAYKKAIEIHQDEPDLHNALGESYGKAGQLDKALACFQRAIAMDSNFLKAYTNTGVTYGKVGKYTEAIAALRQACRLGSSDPMTYYALGQCYILTGQKDSALTAYNKLKTLDDAMANKLKQRIEQ